MLTRYRNLSEEAKAKIGKYDPDDVVIEKRANSAGDGTVLVDVASAMGMVNPAQAHMSQLVHASLPDERIFRRQLEWTIERAKARQVQRAAARPLGLQQLVNYLTRNKVQLPDGRDQVLLSGDAVAGWAAAFNRQVFPDLPVAAEDRGWAANNRGLALIEEQDFSSAAIVMRAAAVAVMNAPGKDRRLTAKLLNNYGWALFRLRQFDEAEKSLKLAATAGNGKAALGIAEIARYRAVLKRFGRAAILEDLL